MLDGKPAHLWGVNVFSCKQPTQCIEPIAKESEGHKL